MISDVSILLIQRCFKKINVRKIYKRPLLPRENGGSPLPLFTVASLPHHGADVFPGTICWLLFSKFNTFVRLFEAQTVHFIKRGTFDLSCNMLLYTVCFVMIFIFWSRSRPKSPLGQWDSGGVCALVTRRLGRPAWVHCVCESDHCTCGCWMMQVQNLLRNCCQQIYHKNFLRLCLPILNDSIESTKMMILNPS